MSRKKPLTVGEVRRQRRAKVAKSKLEMGPAKAKASHVTHMERPDRFLLGSFVQRLDKAQGTSKMDTFEKDYPGPPEYLGRAKERKIHELQARLKDPVFAKRLADQGVHYDDDVLDHVSRKIEVTPMKLGFGMRGAAGSYEPRRGQQKIKVDTLSATPGHEYFDKEATKKTVRHEIEHDFDERFRAAEGGRSLAEKQGKLLEKLGAASGDDSHSKRGKGLHDASRLYSPGHMRIGVMNIRDEVGKEFVTADDLEEVLAADAPHADPHGRWFLRGSMRYLRRMMGTGKSLKEIADLINQVATRQKVAARASKERA